MSNASYLRRPLIVCMALLAAAALSCCGALGPIASGHLDIDATELQSRIEPRFPARHCKTSLLCVELANPLVTLSEGDDRIGFTVDVRIVFGTRDRTGRISLAGRPRYVQSQGQLFLDDAEITHFEMAGVPDEYADWIRTAATLAARNALQAQAVYTLDDGTAKGALAKRTIKNVRVAEGKLRVTFAGTPQ